MTVENHAAHEPAQLQSSPASDSLKHRAKQASSPENSGLTAKPIANRPTENTAKTETPGSVNNENTTLNNDNENDHDHDHDNSTENKNEEPGEGEHADTADEPQDIIPDRIFVGNLPYEVTEDEVRNLTPEFEVVSVEIPRKNFFNRSLNEIVLQSKGYGFITYTNPDDAKTAIGSIVGKLISGREIYAKYALPQNKNKFKLSNANNHNNNNNNNPHNNPHAQFHNNFKKGGYYMNNNFNTHYRNGTPPANFYYPPPALPNGNMYPMAPMQDVYFKPTPQAFFSNLNSDNIKPFFPTPVNFQPISQIQNFNKSKEEKQKKLEKGVPSTTTIFVGNLERNVTVDELRNFMIDLNPQSVKVPRKTLPNDVYRMLKASGVQIQNKGIAFVKFENEENQKKAIESFNGKFWNGKKLNVTVAINTSDDDNEGGDDEVDGDADDLADSAQSEADVEVELKEDAEPVAVDDDEEDEDDVEIEVVVSDPANE